MISKEKLRENHIRRQENERTADKEKKYKEKQTEK